MESTVQVQLLTKRRVITFDLQDVPTYGLKHRTLEGIRVQGGSPLNLPSNLREGEDRRVDTRHMPASKALRLQEFVERHYVRGGGNFDGLSFMRYVTGWDNDSARKTCTYGGDPVSPFDMTPYRAYLMLRDDQPRNGLVGFTDEIGLCVLNSGYPPILASAAALMEAYGADTLFEISRVHD